MTGSESSSPEASGLQSSVTTPCWAWKARSSACCSRGCSSIWLSAGSSAGLVEQPLQVGRLEVADAGRADAALGAQLEQRAPRVDVRVLGRHGPVDEVEVDDLLAQALGGRVEGAQRGLVAVLVVPDLGGQEDLLARDVGAGECPADAVLVLVGRCGVDAAVADLESGGHGIGHLGVRDLPDAEAELRDVDGGGACGQGHVRYRSHAPSVGIHRGGGHPGGPCVTR